MTIAPETQSPPLSSHATRPFYWSVRRELWEYRSAYMAPLITAGIVLLGYIIRLAHLASTVRGMTARPWIEQFAEMNKPFAIAAVGVIIAGLVMSVFYSLGALNNERRDRSILFWKSLPVSDVTTVLSKAIIPLVVVPCIVFAVTLTVQLIMLFTGSAVLAGHGLNAAVLWTYWPPLKMALLLLYVVVSLTLWWAPIYGWLLMISAWTKRMTFLWAVLPPLGVVIVERIALDTGYFAHIIGERLTGFMDLTFNFKEIPKGPTDPMSLITPMRFLEAPGLWLGLVAAVVFLVAAVWLRRNREPV